MKAFIKDFMFRGIIAAGFGPVALAIVYLILQKNGVLDTLTVNEVSIEILSLFALAFLAGGVNAIYHVERFPLMVAILMHGIVLYIAYFAVYLINGWLKDGWISVLAFTVIFVVGYLVIWGVIYFVTRRKAAKLNALLKEKQEI